MPDVESDAGVEHGTLTAYTKRRCRCDLCREFWNAYMVWWRADQRGRLHGSCPTCTCPLPEKPTRVTSPGVHPADRVCMNCEHMIGAHRGGKGCAECGCVLPPADGRTS